jgi:hypothetical protein
VWVAFNRSISFGGIRTVCGYGAGEFPVAENAIYTGQDKGIFQKKQSGRVTVPAAMSGPKRLLVVLKSEERGLGQEWMGVCFRNHTPSWHAVPRPHGLGGKNLGASFRA